MNGSADRNKKPAFAAAILLIAALAACRSKPQAETRSEQLTATSTDYIAAASPGESSGSTQVFMHNVLLRKGPILRVRIKWLRGFLRPTHPNVTVSLDDVNSFTIAVQDGELYASLDELGKLIVQAGLTSGSLSDLQLTNDNGKLGLRAKYHKLFPIQVDGDIDATPDDRIRIHVTKINLMKVPVKGLLNAFHLKAADLIDTKKAHGITVQSDDIYVDLTQVLPPPHLRGPVTNVKVVGNDMLADFGNAGPDVLKREEWHNYLHLRGGTVLFGKLRMTDTDMIMIDTSADEWFDLDLDHYQQQMVYGYSRVTPQAGLQVFMPDVSLIARLKPRVDMDWLKHRDQPPPPASLTPR